MISNLVLRVNSLFKEFKKRIDKKNIFYIEADYVWGRKKLFEWRSKVKDYSLILGAGIHIIRSCYVDIRIKANICDNFFQ